MNLIVLSSSKDSAERYKAKLYDQKFTRMTSGYPNAKKIAKDVHAVVATLKSDEDLANTKSLLKEFEKY